MLGGSRQATPGDLAAEIEWAKARLIRPEDYAVAARRADRTPPLGVDRIATLYDRYEQEKRKRRLVDFDDLLALCAACDRDRPAFAAAQRWQFRHLFVDEYQDVNPLQERLLRAWLGDGDDLCVVGDPNQAIYRWNGADPSFLTQFPRRHPTAEVIQLDRQLPVDAADPARRPPRCWPGPAAGPAPCVPTAPTGPCPRSSATAATRTRPTASPGRCATPHGRGCPGRPRRCSCGPTRRLALIESALRLARIPYRVRGSRGFLDEPEVRELLNGLERLREPLATTLPDLEAGLARRQAELGMPADHGDASPGDEHDPDSAVARRLAAHEAVIGLGRELLAMDPAARTDQLPRLAEGVGAR